MALNPRFAGQRFVAATNAKTLQTLELCKIVTINESTGRRLTQVLDLDYVCPVSRMICPI